MEDAKESEFFEKLMSTFREEAAEHLKAIADGLLEIEKNLPAAEKQQLIETIFREAHSLKGAARSVNQQSILEICQTLEAVFSLWKQNKIKISSESFDVLHRAINAISKAVAERLEANAFSGIIEQLQNLTTKSNDAEVAEESEEHPQDTIAPESPAKSKMSLPSNLRQEKTIRVSLDKINQFFQEAEETLMIKVLFKTQLNHLKHLQFKLQAQEKNLAQMLADNSVNGKEKKWIDSLRKQLYEMKSTREDLSKLLKNAEQNTHVVGTTVDKLLEDLKKIIMQPMAILFDTLPHMIRDISRELAKEIHVEFQGKDIEVDRRVLEGIKDPVIHLIRNAIDHGIETQEERVKQNKPFFGTIRVTAAESEGNNVKLSISDDGTGIDISKIKQAAFKKGLISHKDLEAMSDAEVIKLAFHSDISTSPIVTELSGRGLGLGIVSEKVGKLGGQTDVISIPGQGTTFTLTLPLTLATFRGVQITAAGQEFILPTHNVERIFRLNIRDIKKTENRETVIFDKHSFSFVHLADLLELQKPVLPQGHKDFLFALIVRAAEQTMVFGADAVQDEKEILVKSLGKQHIRVQNIMAATVIETGQVIPILNPVDLITSAIGKGIKAASEEKPNEVHETKKSILLVEDSITTRLLLKNVLVSENYNVITAVDGADAFEILQNSIFDLIVTDIEMPNMDGFTLVEKVRAKPQLKETPIIICSAQGSNKDRKRGIELGANAYLDKNTFNLQSFVSMVKKLIL